MVSKLHDWSDSENLPWLKNNLLLMSPRLSQMPPRRISYTPLISPTTPSLTHPWMVTITLLGGVPSLAPSMPRTSWVLSPTLIPNPKTTSLLPSGVDVVTWLCHGSFTPLTNNLLAAWFIVLPLLTSRSNWKQDSNKAIRHRFSTSSGISQPWPETTSRSPNIMADWRPSWRNWLLFSLSTHTPL